MMATDRGAWAPGWRASHSRSYGEREAQAQARMDVGDFDPHGIGHRDGVSSFQDLCGIVAKIFNA